MPKLLITTEERIYQRVTMVPMAGCWLWLLHCNSDGYGTIKINGINRHAHIVAFEHFRGPVPEGLELDHVCRVRCCVNPWHLEPVTHIENVRRGVSGIVSRDRELSKTHCPHGHEYSIENTYRYKNRRKCSLCRTTQKRKYWHSRGKFVRQAKREGFLLCPRTGQMEAMVVPGEGPSSAEQLIVLDLGRPVREFREE